MLDFLLGTHEFLGNHSFPEFIVGYLFGAALIMEHQLFSFYLLS